jgi:transposase-like protein
MKTIEIEFYYPYKTEVIGKIITCAHCLTKLKIENNDIHVMDMSHNKILGCRKSDKRNIIKKIFGLYEHRYFMQTLYRFKCEECNKNFTYQIISDKNGIIEDFVKKQYL